MVPVEGISEEELLSIAYALEKKSEHPLAHAILQKARRRRRFMTILKLKLFGGCGKWAFWKD